MTLRNEESQTLVSLSKRYFGGPNSWWWRSDINYDLYCLICNKCICNIKYRSAQDSEELVSIHGIQHLKEHNLLVFI